MNGLFRKIWGQAHAFLERPRRTEVIDLLIILGVAGILLGALSVAHEWTGQHRPVFEIDLSPRALPGYVFFSLSRGLIAYALSLVFTLVYGYWAAKDARSERVLIPLLDILQSVPVLGFMPGFVVALAAVFPANNVGLELAAVLMIFTGQAWNMTFSFYHAVKSVPQDLREVADVYRLTWWQRLQWLELPFGTIGLVWNSMMSMAGGWFFLMISESFVLGAHDFRLPGVGSYMSVAVARGDVAAMGWAILGMSSMIVTLDQLLWRPVVAWAQKYRVEEGGYQEPISSWFLDWLKRSQVLSWSARRVRGIARRVRVPSLSGTRLGSRSSDAPEPVARSTAATSVLSWIIFLGLLSLLACGAARLLMIVHRVSAAEWAAILLAAGWTLSRVLTAVVLGTLWTLPAGLAIGLSPKLSRLLQPLVQVAASFPAPMLFPAVITGLSLLGVTLGWGSIVLMLLGTQWYVLFNVIAGATAVPSDLREAARSYRLTRWQRFRWLYFPAVFPYLVTGWVTAAGGAWNASIVSEYVTFKGQVLTTRGLGAMISRSAERADFPSLAASVVVMSAVVVLFNRTVWKSLYRLAERRFSLSK